MILIGKDGRPGSAHSAVLELGPVTPSALQVAVVISIALHAMAMSLHFKFPDTIKFTPPSTLAVVLVNSKTRTAPETPQVLAQANLDGGGNTDQDRQAKTPVPVLKEREPPAEERKAQRKVRELEKQQRELLSQLKNPKPAPAVPPPAPEPKPEPVAEPAPTGTELAASALALARMEAQIARQVEEYNKRPRRQFVGARAKEVRFAQYVEDWRLKVERVGNLNYPSEARGRTYGSLQVTVSIRADGSVESVRIDRPSGHQVLDRAAERIVKLAAPFAAFPPDIRKDTDILVITRTWTFAPGDRMSSD